jgi:predicted GNAT family N-acyltransferase
MTALASINPTNLRYEVLNSSHNLASFDCGLDDEMGLNDFIHNEALDFQRENLGITYLFFYKNTIVGFVTLAMSQIETKQTKVKLPIETTIKDYPALMIGRLAVDNNYRGQDVGKSLCLWCASKAKKLSEELGCRLVITMTNGNKSKFYERCGFDMVPKFEKKSKKWMYLALP